MSVRNRLVSFVLICVLILSSCPALTLSKEQSGSNLGGTTTMVSRGAPAASPAEPSVEVVASQTIDTHPIVARTSRWESPKLGTETMSRSGEGTRTGTPPATFAQVPITFSYLIIGPPGSSSPPILTYTSGGQLLTADVPKQQTTFFLDSRTGWNVTGTLAGSNTVGRWTTAQPTNGIATIALTIDLVYYRQFYIGFTVRFVGGSPTSGANSTTVSFQQFGANSSTLTGSSVWVDTFSHFVYGSLIAGSTPSERWASNSTTGAIQAPGRISRPFFHQFAVTFAYSVLGGGMQGLGYYDPSITLVQFGLNITATLGTTWVDRGSTYLYVSTLEGSSTQERWFAVTTTGTIYGPSTVSTTYYHQYFVTVTYTVIGGGSPGGPILLGTWLGFPSRQVVTTGAWFDSGSTYQLSAALSGSNSTDRWAGTGPASGNVSLGASISGVFYNQYAVQGSYSIVGAATQTSAPDLNFTAFGTSVLRSLPLNAAAPIWIDAGSPYSFDLVLGGSTQAERWKTDSSGIGTINQPQRMSPLYYHQLFVAVSFILVNGSTTASPRFSFSSYGVTNSTLIGTQPTGIWADQHPYFVTNPLDGSNSSERWAAISASGDVTAPGPLTITYHRQYFLEAIGPGAISQWFDSGSTGIVSIVGVERLNQMSGSRITSYSIDGGTSISVAPTRSLLNVTVRMDSAHRIVFTSVTQYHLAVDAGIVDALIPPTTPPTIMGDDYWYDSGTAIIVVLSGVWGRTEGVGHRLTVYSVNGGPPTAIATRDTVTVLSIPSISSPQSIRGGSIIQYQLLTSSGSVSSITPPPVAGDAGWYDSGSGVTVMYDYSWLVTAGQSRTNAVAFDVDGSGAQALSRRGDGTFTVSVGMDRPHRVNIASIQQYHLTITGGDSTVMSVKSQTGDDYYDAGSVLTVRAAYSWNIVNGSSRENLVSYTLDGRTKAVIPRFEVGAFTLPPITFDNYHTLAINGASQYLVSFVFTESSGSRRIIPTSFQIVLTGERTINLTESKIWLDANSTFKLTTVRWEGTDVSPRPFSYGVAGPLSLTILARVYDAHIRVSNSFGGPAQGRDVRIELANGTSITRTTDAQGVVVLRDIPLGKFNATVSTLIGQTRIMGDAATQPITEMRIGVNLALAISVGGAVVAASVLGAWIFVRRRRQAFARREKSESREVLGNYN